MRCLKTCWDSAIFSTIFRLRLFFNFLDFLALQRPRNPPPTPKKVLSFWNNALVVSRLLCLQYGTEAQLKNASFQNLDFFGQWYPRPSGGRGDGPGGEGGGWVVGPMVPPPKWWKGWVGGWANGIFELFSTFWAHRGLRHPLFFDFDYFSNIFNFLVSIPELRVKPTQRAAFWIVLKGLDPQFRKMRFSNRSLIKPWGQQAHA